MTKQIIKKINWYSEIESTSKQMQRILQVYAIENNIEGDFSGKPSHDLHTINFKEIFSILVSLREVELKMLDKEDSKKREGYLISTIEMIRFFSNGFNYAGKTGIMFNYLYYNLKSQIDHLIE